MPERIAAAFSQMFGDEWRLIPHIALKYEEVVKSVQAQFSSLIEATNGDFDSARAQGFPDDFKPLRH